MFKKIAKRITRNYLKKYLHLQLCNLEKSAAENSVSLFNGDMVRKIDIIYRGICQQLYETSILSRVTIKGIPYIFSDETLSYTVEVVARELDSATEYNFDNLNFQPGDIVLDIGANIGMVSIYLAKNYPFLKIYAFESTRKNYQSFLKNIQLNHIPDSIIFAENKAVTKDGPMLSININPNNTGGYSLSEVVANKVTICENELDIPLITLTEIFQQHNIDQLKLLKIDCEGSEYEILYNTSEKYLHRIQCLRGEFHENKNILSNQYNINDLLNYCRLYIKDLMIEEWRD